MALAGWIHAEVEALCSRCGSRDPFEIARNEGIFVSRRDLGKLKGFYWVVNGERHIVLNCELGEETARLICAHELGHDQLHREEAQALPFGEMQLWNQSRKPEYEANLFAAELLLTDEVVLKTLPQIEDLSALAGELGQPTELILFKLKQMAARGYTVPVPQGTETNFLRDL